MARGLTQKEMILDYMVIHGSITALEASKKLGVQRLAARIWDLRHDGQVIASESEQGINRYGRPVRYDRYRVVEENEG